MRAFRRFWCGNGHTIPERGSPVGAESLTDDQKDRLCYTIGRTREILEQGEAVYTIVSTREGQPKDFSFLPLHQYGTLMVTKVMPSACALLDEFFASRDHMARLKQRGKRPVPPAAPRNRANPAANRFPV